MKKPYEISDTITFTAKAYDSVSKICVSVPLLLTNGSNKTKIKMEGHHVKVLIDSYKYIVESESEFKATENVYRNRNGIYKEGLFESKITK